MIIGAIRRRLSRVNSIHLLAADLNLSLPTQRYGLDFIKRPLRTAIIDPWADGLPIRVSNNRRPGG
jgi:hypothetical protein